MNKKFITRLSDEERAICQEVVKKLKGSSEKVPLSTAVHEVWNRFEKS